jgi:hypothetical protein
MDASELHDKVGEAFNGGDIAALVELYEPDGWLFGPEGPVQGHLIDTPTRQVSSPRSRRRR